MKIAGRVTVEDYFNLAHHALGYVVIGVTLATVVMTFDGPIPMLSMLPTVLVMAVGFVLKSTNDESAIKRIVANRDSKKDELITSGWYRLSRNPCYLGQAIMISGFLCIAPSLYSIGCFLIYFLAVNATVSIEEKRLTAKFGDEYVSYMEKVGRWC